MSSAANAAPQAPLISLLDEGASHPSSEVATKVSSKKSDKRKVASISHAAICTEDMFEIKFQEYSVNWSPWMVEVANRWTTVFNAAVDSGKFQTSGPMFVQFTCNRDGSVRDVWIERSSGDRQCDLTQLKALEHCVPLPEFPKASRKKSVTLMYVWQYAGERKAPISRTVRQASKPSTPSLPARISITGKLL